MRPSIAAILATAVGGTLAQKNSLPSVALISHNGPACPAENLGDGFTTRVTYTLQDLGSIFNGQYWYHVGYPQLHAGVNVKYVNSTTWCETTVKVKFNERKQRLLLREHGTRVLATYNLEDGASAQWKFTYSLPTGKELVDTIVVPGPINTGNREIPLNATLTPDTKPWIFPDCASEFTLKYKIELDVTGSTDKVVGEVDSMRQIYQHEWSNSSYPFGVELGIPIGWSDCNFQSA